MARSFQVLPFTLSELFVLLFFILALAMANEVHKREEVEREKAALEAALEPMPLEAVQAVAAAWDQEESIPDDFHELIRRVAEQEQWRSTVERQLREGGADSIRLTEASTAELIEELAEDNRQMSERTERLQQLAGLSDDSSGISREEQLVAEGEQIRRENRDLRSQLANMMGRAGGGMDHPPCWADPQGEIEYAFEATLHTSHVDLREIWPPHRDPDAASIPGMTTAADEHLSYAEFSRRALPILRWSQSQDPPCRHFVRILDRVDGGKQAFKDGLLTVERYFYKLLVD